MNITYVVALKKDHVRKDGTCAIYIDCQVNGHRIRLPIDESVNPKDWDDNKRRVKSSCPIADDINSIIEREKSKINEVRIHARLMDQEMDIDTFREYFHDPNSKKSFLSFYRRQLAKQEGLWENQTIKNQAGTYKSLFEFTKGKLNYGELTPGFLEEYQKFLKKKNNAPNSISTRLKHIKKFVNLAIERGIKIKDPFKNFKINKVMGNYTYLTKDELQKMLNYYVHQTMPIWYKRTLQRFLFSAYTGGIRVSDIRKLTREHINNDIISFIPQKTKRFVKTVHIRMGGISKMLISHSEESLFLGIISEQKMNKYLKEICEALEIKKKISFHAARHTFGTNFIKAGGNVVVLKKIMGHAKVETTMIYVHLAEDEEAYKIGMDRYEAYLMEAA